MDQGTTPRHAADVCVRDRSFRRKWKRMLDAPHPIVPVLVHTASGAFPNSARQSHVDKQVSASMRRHTVGSVCLVDDYTAVFGWVVIIVACATCIFFEKLAGSEVPIPISTSSFDHAWTLMALADT